MTIRKASDVLISLEQKIDNLIGLVNNQDRNIKLLLNRISNLEKKLSKNENLSVIDKESLPKKAILPGLKYDVVLDEHGLHKTFTKDENISDLNVAENHEQREKISVLEGKKARGKISAGKNVPVKQRIFYPDGKNVCLAKVEIFNESNKLVKQLKTNANGQWITSLSEGIYTVNIFKEQNTNKPEVKLLFKIDVSDSPLDLEPITIGISK